MRTRFIALVEVEANDDLTAVDAITEALSDFEPSLRKLSPGLWQVRMRVQADGLAAACANATSVAQAVTGATAVSAQVMSEHHHERGAGLDLLTEQPVSLATRQSSSGSTRGAADLGGVLAGTHELRDAGDSWICRCLARMAALRRGQMPTRVTHGNEKPPGSHSRADLGVPSG